MNSENIKQNKKLDLTNQTYQDFFKEIKDKIKQSRYDALKSVNKELINLYWNIGKGIVEKQNQFGWGKSIVTNLSKDLQKEFPDVKGLSESNLWRMRNFFKEYFDLEKLAPLVREITWSNNVVIFEKIKNNLEREFYIKMTIRNKWSKSVLIHQIESNAYQNFLLNQSNFENTLNNAPDKINSLAIKDEYTFDFLELSESYSERDIELGLLKNIRQFLLEMGGDFAYIGNQYKLNVGEECFYIDLLLFHRRLKSLVAIELKTVKFKPEFAGKMQFYLTALNETVKTEDENPAIGIIICKSKDRTTVEYALKDLKSPMGVATYKLQKELPQELKGLLPSEKEITKNLEKLIYKNE
jgi:predicted nuclease of restriction endonuclease-like (RecB) superfamily